MQLDSALGTPETSPGKEAQAQIDGGRVQGIDRLLQVQAEVFVAVQPTRLGDQYLGQIGVDPPVSHFVGVGQRTASHRVSESEMVELIRPGVQAVCDIAQSFPKGQLGEPHGQELGFQREDSALQVCLAVTLLTLFRGQTKLELPQTRLADFARIPKAQVPGALKRLAKAGIITVTLRPGLPSLIRLTPENWRACQFFPEDEGFSEVFWSCVFEDFKVGKGPM